MLDVGLQMDRERLRTIFTDYGLLGRTLLANFVVVPILGVILVRLFKLSDPIAAGVLLMAISPGGRGVLVSGGRAHGGSLAFAITLAFILPAFSIITVPITAHYVLASAHIATGSLILVLVVFQLVPLLIGMLVNDRWPSAAGRLIRPLYIFTMLVLLVVVIPIVPILVRSVTTVYGSLGILAMLSIVVLSIVTGWVLGGPQREHQRTLALGTALRSFAFCAVIATKSFPGTEATAAVVTYLLVQIIVTALVGAYFKRTAKLTGAAA